MKKVILSINILLLLCASNMMAQQDTSSSEKMSPQAAIFYNKAVENLKDQKYDAAIAYFDSSLQISPNYRTYYQEGQAYIKMQKYDDAARAFNESVKLNDKNDQAYLALGNVQLILKEYDKSIATYNKAIQVSQSEELKKAAQESIEFANNSKAIDYFNRGNEFFKDGKYNDALKNYDMSLSLNSKDPKTYYQKGLTYSKMNNDKDAEKAWKKAIEVDSTFDFAYIALAVFQTRSNDFDDALKNYQKVLSVSGNENLKNAASDGISSIYLIQGNNAFKKKRYDTAIDNFQKAIEQKPSDNGYLLLTKAYIEKKQYDNALKAIDSTEVYKNVVSDGAIDYYKGLIYFNMGENKRAIEFFTAGLKDPAYKKACKSQIDYIVALEKGAKPRK